LLVFYGPFAHGGVLEPESNRRFDASLRERDASFGVRDIDDVSALCRDAGLTLGDKVGSVTQKRGSSPGTACAFLMHEYRMYLEVCALPRVFGSACAFACIHSTLA